MSGLEAVADVNESDILSKSVRSAIQPSFDHTPWCYLRIPGRSKSASLTVEFLRIQLVKPTFSRLIRASVSDYALEFPVSFPVCNPFLKDVFDLRR